MKNLVVKQVSKTFVTNEKTSLRVLNNVNLHVGAGEFVALVGPSGCGKTTLLDCMAGLNTYDNGTIFVGEDQVFAGNHFASYLMRDDGLLPWRSVVDNIILSCELQNDDTSTAQKKAQKLIKKFGLAGFEHYYPHALSGGMRQRVALARTYLVEHDLLLMDEPFARLDALTKMSMQQWFLDVWQKDKKTVLFVTHDIDEALLLADRVYIMSERPGRIIAEYAVSIARPRKYTVTTSRSFIRLKTLCQKSLGVIKQKAPAREAF